MRLLLTFALTLCLAVPALAETTAEKGRVLLTVAGDLPNGNVPPGTMEDKGFFAYHELVFDTGFGFDQRALDALTQVEVTKTVPGTDKAAAFTGPLLSDVLEMAGATGKTVFPLAMDGYSAQIKWSDIEQDKPILATRIDGEPMALGRLGPAMVVFPPTDNEDRSKAHGAMEVWSVVYIGAE